MSVFKMTGYEASVKVLSDGTIKAREAITFDANVSEVQTPPTSELVEALRNDPVASIRLLAEDRFGGAR